MYYTQRLKELRKESGLTQQAAAEKTGIKREQYEGMKTSQPYHKALRRISRVRRLFAGACG
ncbi:protein of unknown function [Ruminococcaceae bacterium BL-6]|nr:protein of unknown function [Ruminococcaceae bacterium BL-6]